MDTKVLPRSPSEMKGRLFQVLKVLILIDSPQAVKPSSVVASAKENSLSQSILHSRWPISNDWSTKGHKDSSKLRTPLKIQSIYRTSHGLTETSTETALPSNFFLCLILPLYIPFYIISPKNTL